MKIRAAVLEATHGLHHMQELDLAPPGPREVLVRLGASGVCRSDYNAIDGTTESPCPVVLGHEGAGVVEAIGPGVTRNVSFGQPGTRSLHYRPLFEQGDSDVRYSAPPSRRKSKPTGRWASGTASRSP